MKKNYFLFIVLLVLGIFITACEEDKESADNSNPPELPQYETMAPDFSIFLDNSKSAGHKNTHKPQSAWNISIARITVAVWNAILYKTLIVPVISYEYAFAQTPEKLDNGKWQWSYSLGGDYSTYSANLTGEMRSDDIKWEMRIKSSGEDAFDEFLWFEGTSKLDKSGGTWILYHSPEFSEEVITIDWSASGGMIDNTRYDYVREFKDDRTPELFNGSYLEYGINEENAFNLFYNIHYFSEADAGFVDVTIEMNETDNSGRIKSTNWAGGNTDWHCWDSNFEDIDCE
jgi:hypothetical protein